MVGRWAVGQETGDEGRFEACRGVRWYKMTDRLQPCQGQLACCCGATLQALARSVASTQEGWQRIAGGNRGLNVQTVLDIQINATASYVTNLGCPIVAKHLLNPKAPRLAVRVFHFVRQVRCGAGS